MDEALKQALESQGIRLLRSDNICIGGRIPLPDGTVGIICGEEGLNEKTDHTDQAGKR